ncbi:MAG: sensor domain-containing diguanylate cyclase, partial [Miltoncostaeaceae bacterium]
MSSRLPAHLDVQRFRRGSLELLGAALAASFDDLHLFRRAESGGAFERVGGSPHSAEEPWYDPQAFEEAMERGVARDDEIEGPEGLLIRRIVPAAEGVGVSVRPVAASPERREPHELEVEQDALRRISTAVCARVGPELLLDTIAREVGGVLGVDAARVCRFEGDTSVVVGSWGEPSDVAREAPLAGGRAVPRVASTGRPARVHDYRALAELDGDVQGVLPAEYRSGVAAPVFVGPRVWGAVVAFDTRRPGAFGVHEERRLNRLAELLAMAIASADERAQVAAQATTDALTGLANHREFQEKLAAEVQRARRYGRQMSLSIFNLDHFK